jgi:hypothetical protein
MISLFTLTTHLFEEPSDTFNNLTLKLPDLFNGKSTNALLFGVIDEIFKTGPELTW